MSKILFPQLRDVPFRSRSDAGAMKSLTITAAALALLVGCSSSPIKSIECAIEGEEKPEVVIFDKTTGEVYDFDEFSETLKPIAVDFEKNRGDEKDELTTALTDSGKLKIRQFLEGNGKLVSLSFEETIDLQKMTYSSIDKTKTSKLEEVEYLWGKSLSDAIAHNKQVLESGESVIEVKTETRKGTCRYITPQTTKVFAEEVE